MSGRWQDAAADLTLDYECAKVGSSYVVHADCFDWLRRIPENSIHAVVTDPPYGVREYDPEQLEKRENGNGGVWRLPPTLNGQTRAPVPRFTELKPKERARLRDFFAEWAGLVCRALRPGGHVFIASNASLCALVFAALSDGGLEFRGQLIRLVVTLRGGDRPKNAELEYPEVLSLPRGCYEPWGMLRKPLPPKMTVADCLREFQTGGIRCKADGSQFGDVIASERTPKCERTIAGHPSLKPQSFLRQVVRVALPLAEGVVVDPFMGSGSTVAAAAAVGYHSIGVERSRAYFDMARDAVPQLAALYPEGPPTLPL